jgi:hypothetical protein
MVAFVIGNGISRKNINLNLLKGKGTTYGCNALYRDFTPDVLVACDRGISKEIQETGYAHKHKFYTRNPLPDSNSLPLRETYQKISSGIRLGYSSGPNALHLAVSENHKKIYLLGFDFGSTGKKFNNCYADTDHYKGSIDSPTTGVNWEKQVYEIIKKSQGLEYVHVIDKHSNHPKKLKDKLKMMQIEEFLDLLKSL